MKKTKVQRGITLISLIITIVILMVLAAVAISSIQNDGIIAKTDQATFISKVKQYEEELNLYIYEKQLDGMVIGFDANSLSADKDSTPSIADIIKSISKNDQQDFIIKNGKLIYVGNDTQKKYWSKNSGIIVNSRISKIYGNSVQNGTPTPETPIEIESVGDKTKNLLNPAFINHEYTHAGITYKYLEDEDCFLINGAYDGTVNSSQLVSSYFILPNETGTNYTLSATYISGSVEGEGYFFFGSNDSINNRSNWLNIKFQNGDYSKTKICEQKYITAFWFYCYNDAVFKDYKVKIQLEKGTTATDYEPYGYKIPIKVSNDTEEITTNIYLDAPLRKIGDYADYIDFANKMVVRNIGKKVLNGTEVWYGSGSYYTGITGKAKTTNVISSILPYASSGQGRITGTTANNAIDCYVAQTYSMEEWKALLAVKNMEVLYQLEKPDPQPIELPAALLDESFTNMSIETEIQPSNIEY